MANHSKKAGTAFESGVVWFLREHLGEESARRLALAGVKDEGDILLNAAGHKVAIECKYRKDGIHRRSELDIYRRQTLKEQENAAADIGVLVTNAHAAGARKGSKKMGQNVAHLRLQDLKKLCNDDCGDLWVTVTLETLMQIIEKENS